jgi:hypothetical protein
VEQLVNAVSTTSYQELCEKKKLCASSVLLCVSVVSSSRSLFTTETQRLHRVPRGKKGL